ncbi:MAG: gamma carbonic anhydrase family protein [Magnetococcales bacterium]|nr:gamma carbonic anhydrase family protein [Magnetococcales bacterium]
MPILPFEGVWPKIDPTAFIHPEAVVIGRVWVGPEASLWPGVVARGDVNEIRIGAGSNIQDATVLHVSRPTPRRPEGFPLILGDGVTVGHRVILHGCVVEAGCMIGMGSVVLDGVTVGREAMVGAAALVAPGKVIPPGAMWLGAPAQFKRDLTPEELQAHRDTTESYRQLARRHRASLAGIEGAFSDE